MLPDNVLLEIFDLYRKNSENESIQVLTYYLVWKWHLLVHVCRSWRQLIFASPHRLHLRIFCTERSPVRNDLGIWPAFPIAIGHSWRGSRPEEEENIIAALEQPNRVCFLRLYITGSELEKMATVMQQTFPLLTCLGVFLTEGNAPVLPDGFLGGSAPRLTSIALYGIPYPALPTLLLSTSDLVILDLHGIPPTGYISSEAMALSLATLPRLEVCTIGFQSATPHSDRMRPPPITRAVLPALTSFKFIGAIEYLDDLVSRIDGPQLKQIFVNYLNHFVDFPVAQISQFINRSVGPELPPLRHAQVNFSSDGVTLDINGASYPHWDRRCVTIFSRTAIYWQASHMAQVFSQFSATLSTVVHLELKLDPNESGQLHGTDDVEWLHLFHQLPAVQTLCVSRRFAAHVLALGNTTGSMNTGVFPCLHLICLQDQPASSVEKFVTARRLSGRPVTVINTYIEYAERLTSYGVSI